MAETDEPDFSNPGGTDNIDWSDIKGESRKNRETLNKKAKEAKQPSAETTSFGAVTAGAEAEPDIPTEMGIDCLSELPLQLSVEVGRAKISIKDLRNIDIGSIIEFKKKAGDAMNILVNDKLVAKGKIIVRDQRFALRITEILDPEERVRSIQEN